MIGVVTCSYDEKNQCSSVVKCRCTGNKHILRRISVSSQKSCIVPLHLHQTTLLHLKEVLSDGS
jgi:hypothetical protein